MKKLYSIRDGKKSWYAGHRTHAEELLRMLGIRGKKGTFRTVGYEVTASEMRQILAKTIMRSGVFFCSESSVLYVIKANQVSSFETTPDIYFNRRSNETKKKKRYQ